jgi:hypothetical protein
VSSDVEMAPARGTVPAASSTSGSSGSFEVIYASTLERSPALEST